MSSRIEKLRTLLSSVVEGSTWTFQELSSDLTEGLLRIQPSLADTGPSIAEVGKFATLLRWKIRSDSSFNNVLIEVFDEPGPDLDVDDLTQNRIHGIKIKF